MSSKPFRLTSQITVALMVITAIAALLIVAVAVLAAQKVDQLYLERQRDFLTRHLEESITSISKEQGSITMWDDAVFHTRARDKQWMGENFGTWLHVNFGHDLGYVIDANDNIIFAVHDGKPSVPAGSADERMSILQFVNRLRQEMKAAPKVVDNKDPRLDMSLTRVMLIDGRPAIVGTRPILPSTKRTTVLRQDEFVHVAARFVDGSLLSIIGKHARAEGLHFEPGTAASFAAAVPVNGDDHFPIGHLSWKPVTPGFMLIQQIAPAALFGFGVVVSAVFILGLGLRNTSQKLLASKAELVSHRGELEETVRVRTAEIERQAAELDRMLKQERQVNARQRQFVAMASHEFRTPLAVIDAAAQRLIRQKETPPSTYISEKVEQIRHSVARMVDLMESILSVGRLAEGVNGIQRTEVDIKQLVAACCQRQGEIRKSHRFHLQFEDFPSVVNADGPALEQVLTNLVANAIKYAPNSPDIMIRGREQDGAVYISIQDFGIGMDAEDIPMLFQPYFRARSATGIAGTGIGLNLAKQIIELHGGTITVESELGRGTTFTIALPMNLHTDSSLPEKSREAA